VKGVGAALAGLVGLLVAAPAQAATIRAETVLPPGQSGFVSLLGVTGGTGSPHLYDQTALFTSLRWKPASFGQPGAASEPRPGVRIVRDRYGVPAVTAASELDMWWGAGYAVAQDRLFQLELFRRATTGTLSEVVGRRYLDDDRIVRRDLYTPGERARMFAQVAPGLRARFDAYRDGVNAWIDHVRLSPAEMPAEFPVTATELRPWTVDDSVAIGIYLARTIPTNSDPEGVELSNMRGAQLGGARALNALVPLRTARSTVSVPASAGRFPSQPGRTLRHERAALKRSLRFVRDLPYPDARGAGAVLAYAAPRTALRSFAPRLGGSYMVALRRPADRHALLHSGPQLGFDAPEKLLELELHAPGIDLRGMTAPGIPVIGSGFNGHGVAWGVTTGASDTDDLYAERLSGGSERYAFRGATRAMDCRTETLRYDSPPSDLLAQRVPEAGAVDIRLCRTLHGPVQARAGGTAYARRYASWLRELETLEGLAGVNAARNLGEVDAAVRKMTWNENLMAVDAQGHIGYWHPGLHPLRARRWDERLPLPGTGEAEWRGLLDRARIPAVIDPRQGWLANWNNLPSVGWTAGDGTARKRLDGPFFRAGWLFRLAREAARAPSFERLQDLVVQAGTVAQQFPIATSRLRRAASGASGGARQVLDTLLAWDGSYHRTDANGTVHPGVAAWDALRAAAADVALAPFGEAADWLAPEDAQAPLFGGYHHAAGYHFFDATHGESHALRTLRPAGLRDAAQRAFDALAKRFRTDDPARWREPRRMYEVGAVGATSPDPIPFFDRGTYEQFVEVGP
jgi:acyl-homoserine lactone acylase PvdQ